MLNKSTRIHIGFAFAIGLTLGLVFNTFNIIGFDFSRVPGDLGDSRLNNYFLEHCHQFFIGNVENFWELPMMYPEKSAMTFSDNLLGTAPLYSFFRLTGFSRADSYQFWIILMSILNFTATFFVLQKIIKNPYASSIGAYIFAFSLALNSQLVTTQMYPRFPIPLAILMLYYFHEKLNPKYFFLALFILVYQFYAVIYHGFFLAVIVMIVTSLVLISKRGILLEKLREKTWLIKMAGSVIINLALLMLLMYPYYQRSLISGTNLYENIFTTLPTVVSFFYSPTNSFSWESLAHVADHYPLFYIHFLFSGIFATGTWFIFAVLLIVGIFKSKIIKGLVPDQRIRILLYSGLIFFLIFTRWGDFSLYKLFFNIPGFGAIRNLCRMINFHLFFYGLTFAIASLAIFKKSGKYSATVFILMIGLIAIDNHTMDFKHISSEKAYRESRSDKLVAKLQHLPKGSVFSYEPDSLIDYTHVYHLDAMLAAQELGMKCVNGYSGNQPAHFWDYSQDFTTQGRLKYFAGIGFEPKDTIYVVK